MCREITQFIPKLPKNVEKALFAEDFMNFILQQFSLPTFSSDLDKYRKYVYKAFNQNVAFAAYMLYRRLEEDIFNDFKIVIAIHPVNRDAFNFYLTNLYSDSFDARKLLQFCVKITTMAARFYFIGFNEGPAIAVERITHILQNFDLYVGGWDGVNLKAENYARVLLGLENPADSDSDFDVESEPHSPFEWEYSDSAESETSIPEDSDDDTENEDDGESESDPVSSDPEKEFSDESCSGSTSVREIVEDEKFIHEDVQGEFPCDSNSESKQGPSDDIKASCSLNTDAKTSNDDESKYEVQEQGSETSSSVYLGDTDGEYDSDVFLERADAITSCDKFGQQTAKKRPASSSSSTCGIAMPGSPEQTGTGLNNLSILSSKEELNNSSPVSECSAGPSQVETSPIRKHVAKTRKQC